MDKPEETEPTPPRRRGNLFWRFVLLLTIPVVYLASMGPVMYLERRYETPGDNSPLLIQFYMPALRLRDSFQPYSDYIVWFATKADAARKADQQ